MRRYFFNVTGKTMEFDVEGTDLPSAEYAKREGQKLFGAVLAQSDFELFAGGLRLDVVDEDGALVICFEMTSHQTRKRQAARTA